MASNLTSGLTSRLNSKLTSKLTNLPIPLGGLQLWENAANTSTILNPTVSGKVDKWVDESSNGNDSTQTTPTSKPTTGVTELNSKNVLDFDGGDILEIDSSLLSMPSGPSTLFVVPKRNVETGVIEDIFMMKDAGIVVYGLRFGSVPGQVTVVNGGFKTSSGHNNTNFQLISAFREGASYGVEVAGGGYETANNAVNTTPILGQIGANGAGAFKLNGSIAEIILYDRNLSGSEKGQVSLYLADKYGLYYPNANWIKGYSEDRQSIIHALKLNKDDAFQDTPGNTLLGWFKAQDGGLKDGSGDIITADSTPIAQALDFSGHVNNTDIQTTGTARPIYTASGINSIGTMTCDGGDFLDLPSEFYSVTNGSYTIFLVLERDTSSPNFENSYSFENGSFLALARYGSGTNVYAARSWTTGSVASAGDIGLGPNVINVRRDSTAIGCSANNGSEGVTFNAIDTVATSAAILAKPGGLLGCIGKVSEIIIIQENLDATSRGIINNYLGDKYNITQS